MSPSDEQINEMVDNLYYYICEDTKLTYNSKKGTSLITKKGLNSTQLHLNHVRRIQVD